MPPTGAPDSLIGEKIGSYVVLSKIGEGGMGAVYLAMHPEIKRQVAIKVLLPDLSARPDAVQRFFNEAKASARLRHPALVDTIDFGTRPDGSFYIIMEYLEGESLGARLKRTGTLTPLVAAFITRQIAEGVGVAHAAGIVHRDLKPDNVFLTPHPAGGQDLVKILDFGIAKQNDPDVMNVGQTKTGAMIGTPLFMAPEQCRGAGQVDHRADFYSLGCIMYCMLCGRPPFLYNGAGELIAAHLYEPPAPPRSLDPSIPEALEAVVMKALAKKREERYQDAGQLIGDIDNVISALAGRGPSQAGAPWWQASTQYVAPTPPPGGGFTGVPTPASRTPWNTPPSPRPPAHAVMQGRTQVLEPTAPAQAAAASRRYQAGGQKTTLSSATGDVSQPVPDLRPSRGKGLIVIAAAGVLAAGVGLFVAFGSGPSKPKGSTAVQLVESPPPPVVRREPPPPEPEPAKPSPPPEELPPREPPLAAKPAKVATAEPRKKPEPTPRSASSSDSSRSKTIRVVVSNPPEGMVVFVDGRPGKFPLRLPLDQGEHVLRFESPTTRPETRTIRADKDQTIDLANKLRLLVD